MLFIVCMVSADRCAQNTVLRAKRLVIVIVVIVIVIALLCAIHLPTSAGFSNLLSVM